MPECSESLWAVCCDHILNENVQCIFQTRLSGKLPLLYRNITLYTIEEDMRICLHLNKTEQYYKNENKISMTNENDGLIGCLLMLTMADQSLYSLFVFKNIFSLFSLCHKEWPLLLHSAQVTFACGKTVNLRHILLPMGCCTQSGQIYSGTVAKCPPSASWSGVHMGRTTEDILS